jgi:hypothetical protein
MQQQKYKTSASTKDVNVKPLLAQKEQLFSRDLIPVLDVQQSSEHQSSLYPGTREHSYGKEGHTGKSGSAYKVLSHNNFEKSVPAVSSVVEFWN